jgi:hypothetical protein
VPQGQQGASVALTGQNTSFQQGVTTADFGPGITVVSLTVTSATSANAIINVDPAAALGLRPVQLTTGSEQVFVTPVSAPEMSDFAIIPGPLDTSTTATYAQGTTCNASGVCICKAGFADCNGNQADGCETRMVGAGGTGSCQCNIPHLNGVGQIYADCKTPGTPGNPATYDDAISRGVEWIVGLQSRNGGWAAFDADNVDHYLNNIPFADHGALLDPPTADVSARCISMLAQLGETKDSPRMRAALDYLEREQMADGSWFGRWGVNYVYGTWSVLCALNVAGFDATAPSVAKAADWLVAIQNADGGWGEDCTSYKLDYRGYEPASSNASQTAWALLGLMAAGQLDHPAVARGIAYLQRTQDASGLWRQDAYTGGGFPRVFYLRYHGYPQFFPLWALARYRNLRRSNVRRVVHGM